MLCRIPQIFKIMKTIIFDIDGTLTDMSLLEKVVALGFAENCWPKPEKYPLVNWILKNKNNYRFVYATGGKGQENSINKTNYRFPKKTGLPFIKIRKRYPDCVLITDSQTDCDGATIAKIRYIKIKPRQVVGLDLNEYIG
jgi:hypothetical protein